MNLYKVTIMESKSVSYETLLAENIELNRKIGNNCFNCCTDINIIKSENKTLKEKIKELEIKVAALESHNLKLIHDNNILYNKSFMTDAIVYSMQMHNAKINNECYNLYEKVIQLELNNKFLVEENINLHNKIIDLETNINILNDKHIDLKNDISILKEENKVLREENINLKNDISILKEENKVLKEENINLKNDVKLLKDENKALKIEIVQLKSDIAYERHRNNLLMSIQDVNAANELEKNINYPYNTLFRSNRSKRVTSSHFIIEDDDENTLNHKYYALLQYLKSLPADIKKTFDKYIDKTEKLSIIDKVIEFLSEQDYNNINNDLLDECVDWFTTG